MAIVRAIPEQGQLVNVRSRQFVVTDVRNTTLPTNPMLSAVEKTQHLVSLSSVEDDGLGEELQVIWELEPGALVYEKMELPKPTGFDAPARLDAFLDAVRWGAASIADIRTLQSPFRSGIDIEDYQLDPVVRAIQMPRVNLLIADDVGLGKTIEAGLVAQELIIRHRCRRILIVCPSSLQIQWRDQMRDKFGLDFRVVDSTLMKELRRKRGIHVNPWQHFPRLITSIDFLKRDRERVIIFTEYRATQKWLYNLLAVEGLVQGDRLMTLYGGMKSEDREQVKAAFQASPDISPVRILLATDAASEGLDLQNFCSRLIHYEIPWNPNRMEQRNGRIDRHGQKAQEVKIYHFVGKDYQHNTTGLRPGELEGDLEFLMRAVLKINNIREDLGKVGPVIAAQVEEAMLGYRTVLDTTVAERESEVVRRMLKFERQVREQIEKLREQLDETRQHLRLTPDNIEAVVKIGLKLAQQPPLIATEIEGIDGQGFYLPPLKSSWAVCSEGLAHPHTKEIRPIVFDPQLAHGRDDVVLAHLNHRLVQMCLRLLRAEVWSKEGRKALHRVTARLVPNSVLDTPAVIAYGRLVILGSDQQRLHEEVITAGGLLKEGKFNRLGVMKIQSCLAAALPELAPSDIREKLAQLWDSHASALMQALEARMQDRSKSLQRDLGDRAQKEAADITAILTELRQSILNELDEPEFKQLELFNTAEKEQFERNVNSLKVRVEQIPAEIEREVAAIQARFANPTPRLFPLAVTYLIPQKLAR